MQAAKRVDSSTSEHSKSPSESQADREFYVSYGLIMSVRLVDVDRIRGAVEQLGGKIAFQTVTPAPLYLLRHYEIEQILRGDRAQLLQLREVHDRKSKERREVEKIG